MTQTMEMRAALATLALAALVAAPAALSAQGGEEVEVEATHVAGQVWMLEGRGGNIGVSTGEDGILIVDDQFAELSEEIRAALGRIQERATGGSGGGVPSVAYVLNTHWHPDHTGGNEVFGREASIIAHENVRARLARDQLVRGDTVPAEPDHALPVITFDRSVSVHFNGEEIRVVHLPEGHTDGDAVIHFQGSNVVHMGDHMFAGRFPFVDLETGGDVAGYLRNVEHVLHEVPDDAAVIPGHGPLTDMDGLRRFHRMLQATTSIVRDRMERGTSLEEAKAAGLPEEWRSYGQGFISTEQWIETIWRSYSEDG